MNFRFFSRKRDASNDRLKKGKTPEPAMDGDVSPERKPIGMGRTSTLHVRTPQVRVSQVSIIIDHHLLLFLPFNFHV